MDEYKDYFVHGNKKMKIKGCMENGIPEKKASELWDIMALASSYSFNKSHAVAYSIHSIRTAWLSHYYPYEYMTAVLNSFSTDTEKLGQYLDVARNKKMKLLPPTINGSEEKFSTDGKAIQIGISGIKGINAIAEDIIQERKKNGKFNSFEEFLERMSYYKNFSKKTLESLTYAGMLDEYYGSRKNKIDQLAVMSEYVKKLKDYRKKLTDGKKHRVLEKPVLSLQESTEEFDKLDVLLKEKDYVGMYISGNPMKLFDKYTGKMPDCSSVKSGKTVVCGIVQNVERKVSKKGNTFYTFKLENNGIISGIFFSKNGETIANNDVVKLEGDVKINEFGKNITVRVKEDLSFLRKVCEDNNTVVIQMSDKETKEAFNEIKFPTGNRTIVAINEVGKKKNINNVSFTPSLVEKLIETVGIENIIISVEKKED